MLSLNGTTEYAPSANTGVLDTSASFTIFTWVKLSSTPSKDATAFSVNGTTDSPFYLKYNANGGSPKWAFQFPATDTTSPPFKGATGGTPSAASWTHLVGVYNAATQTAQLYVNGSLMSTATGISTWKASGALNAGAALYNGSMMDYFPGEISGSQLYNYALTANQVTALYDQIP